MSIARRVAATAGIARQALGQRSVPYRSDAERNRLRDDRVRRIVQYAAETVPHYRDLFRDQRIDPREIRTAEDLERLPLLDRAQLERDPDRFVSTSGLGREALSFPTNGTTGTPLVIRHDRRSVLANIAFGERERVVEARLTGRRTRYVVADVNYGPRDTGYQVLRFYRSSTVVPIRPARHMLSISDDFDRIVQTVDRLRPDVLQGYGSYLEAFFERLAREGTEMHAPRLVLYGSDTMTPRGRHFVEERFGLPVISRYNAVEAFKIGFACERRRGIHVEDDLCHLRIVDAGGSASPTGVLGEVVISNLVNHGTVLLNYRLGDVAAWSAERCDCGRLTPVLTDVEGRLERTLHLPDGRFVPEGAIQVLLKDRGLLTFQLVQLESQRYDLRLLASSRAEYERILSGAVRALTDRLGGAVIEPSFHRELAPGPRGVFRYVLPHRAT